jgi:hypothetical protein
LDAKNLIDVRGYMENLEDTKKTDLLHGSPGANPQNDLISSTSGLLFGTDKNSRQHTGSAPRASNRRGSEQLETYVRTETERVDRGKLKDVLTIEDGRDRPDFVGDDGRCGAWRWPVLTVMLALQFIPGDERGLFGCVTTSRTARWWQLRPVVPRFDGSTTVASSPVRRTSAQTVAFQWRHIDGKHVAALGSTS